MTHSDGQKLPPFGEPEKPAREPAPAAPKEKRTRAPYSTKRKARPDEEIVRRLPEACASELAAVEFVEHMRWGGAPKCPRCGSLEVAQMKKPDGSRNARFLWRCFACKAAKRHEQFTVRVGTVYEDSRLPMTVWTTALWMMASAKNGVSALELARVTRRTHKSCLFVLHRLRFAMATDWSPEPKLSGPVVADETYVGPQVRRRLSRKQRNRIEGRGTGPTNATENKVAVLAVVHQVTGEVRTRTVRRVTAKNLGKHLRDNVEMGESMLLTDKEPAYRRFAPEFGHGHRSVNHSIREYVRYDDDGVVVTTNPCESFFSRLKRALVGTFHSVSTKHCHRYASQFEFLANSRAMSDGERLVSLVRRADGKRLTYAQQIGA